MNVGGYASFLPLIVACNNPRKRADVNYEIAAKKIGVFWGSVLHIHVKNLHL